MSTPSSSSPSLSLSVDSVQRRLCNELLSISSKASCNMEWRWSGYRSDGQSEQTGCGKCCLSDSLQGVFRPLLPGQVPVEPAETSNDLIASSVINSSTEKPSQHRMKKGFCSFVKRIWKFIKRPFRGCCCSSAVDVVEPLGAEPKTVPDHVGVKPNKESFESLYDVERLIGFGGFGMVFEGKRKFDGKKVAIKQMRKIDNDQYLVIPGHPKPLVTEVALLLMMRKGPRSPYVIELFDWFEHPRKFTLIMEYPEPCESLLDFLIRNRKLDEKTARSIMRQAVLAVQHCIEHGVFHNDIHPQNLLLNTDTSELKLIDFGSGQLLSSDGYESDKYIGLVDYCPPEIYTQPRFHAVPTNVWSLGVLLYEMTNSCPPFRNSDEITQMKVRFQNFNLSKECMDLIIQCLNLDPTERPTLEQILQHKWFSDDLL